MSELLDDLVTANHILFRQGVLDAYGHVSARDPENPRRFFLSRHMAPALVTAQDILTFDLEGNLLAGGPAKPYTETAIHAAAYAARPDVGGVVHSHSPSIVPFGVTKTALRPVHAYGAFLDEGAAHFDTRAVAGDTDLMIRTMELGRALLAALGEKSVVLMRGHGATVVGLSLREAVFRAVYLEVNAKLQSESMRMGEVEYLSPGEARLLNAHMQADPSYRRAWEFWSQGD